MENSNMKIITENSISEEFVRYYIEKNPSEKVPVEFVDLLKLFDSTDEIDGLVESIIEKQKSDLINSDSMYEIIKREYEIWEDKVPEKPLEIAIAFKVDRITIPDIGRDEIEISLTIASSVNRDKLLEYLVFKNIVNKEKMLEYKNQWSKGEIIGTSEDENKLLEVLKISISDSYNVTSTSILYNVTEEMKIARTEYFILTLPTRFNYSAYPFDHHELAIEVFAENAEDITGTRLCSDEKIKNSWVEKIILPRGFEIKASNQFLFSRYVEGYTPVDVYCYVFKLKRLPQTSMWRIFLPTFVIMLLILSATGFSLQTKTFIESVMTSVLPGVLFACVALQLVAAQSVPPHSGRTFEDLMFIGNYLVLFLSFVSLLLADYIFSWLSFSLALLIFFTSNTIYFNKIGIFKLNWFLNKNHF